MEKNDLQIYLETKIINYKMFEFVILIGDYSPVVKNAIDYYSSKAPSSKNKYKLVSVQRDPTEYFFQERGLDELCISIEKKGNLLLTLDLIKEYLGSIGYTDRLRTNFIYTFCTHYQFVPRLTIAALNVFGTSGKVQILRTEQSLTRSLIEKQHVIDSAKYILNRNSIPNNIYMKCIDYFIILDSESMDRALRMYMLRNGLTTYFVFSGSARSLYRTQEVFPKTNCILEQSGTCIYDCLNFSREIIRKHSFGTIGNTQHTILCKNTNSVKAGLSALSVFSGQKMSFQISTAEQFDDEDGIINTIDLIVKKHTQN